MPKLHQTQNLHRFFNISRGMISMFYVIMWIFTIFFKLYNNKCNDSNDNAHKAIDSTFLYFLNITNSKISIRPLISFHKNYNKQQVKYQIQFLIQFRLQAILLLTAASKNGNNNSHSHYIICTKYIPINLPIKQI